MRIASALPLCLVASLAFANESVPLLQQIASTIDTAGFGRGACDLGDPNGDGQCNSTDALWIIQYEFGLRDGLTTATSDLNGDLQINSTDALWCIQIEFGLRDPLCPVDIGEFIIEPAAISVDSSNTSEFVTLHRIEPGLIEWTSSVEGDDPNIVVDPAEGSLLSTDDSTSIEIRVVNIGQLPPGNFRTVSFINSNQPQNADQVVVSNPEESCIEVREGDWTFTWEYQGQTSLVADGPIVQTECFVQFDDEGGLGLRGDLVGSFWDASDEEGGVEVELIGNFIGDPAESFVGTWSSQGVGGDFLGEYQGR